MHGQHCDTIPKLTRSDCLRAGSRAAPNPRSTCHVYRYSSLRSKRLRPVPPGLTEVVSPTMVRFSTAAIALLGAVTPSAVTATGANPVRKVVTLLQKMQAQVVEEGKTEKKLFDEYMCYCKTGGQTLELSIQDSMWMLWVGCIVIVGCHALQCGFVHAWLALPSDPATHSRFDALASSRPTRRFHGVISLGGTFGWESEFIAIHVPAVRHTSVPRGRWMIGETPTSTSHVFRSLCFLTAMHCSAPACAHTTDPPKAE